MRTHACPVQGHTTKFSTIEAAFDKINAASQAHTNVLGVAI